MAVIALVHASEGSFDTRPTALVNSAPSGLTFSNIGSDSNGGGQFWFGGEGPYGQALRTEGESGAGVAIVCDQTFSFGKGMTHEGFTSGFDDSGREFWEIRENVTDFPTWWIRVRCIPVTGTTWRLWLQVKLPGYDLLEVESSTFTETSPTNGHWLVTQWNDDGTFSLHVEGTRVLLTTETFDTTLTGAKLAIFGSYRGTYAGGFYSQLVGEFRFSTHQVYSGATLTVPTARFPNPANEAAAAQTLGGVVSTATAKLPVRIPGGGSIGAFDAAVFDATVFDIGVINAQTLGGITQVATATVGAGAGRQIAAAQTLGGVSQAATAAALVKATAGQTLGGIVSSATATTLAKAAAAQTLGGITQAATLTAGARAAATQTLGGITQAATATVTAAGTRVASAAQTLDPIVQTASATSSMRAAAAQTLGGIAQTATLTNTSHATATQALGGIAQTATATVTAVDTRLASASQTLGPIAQAATLTSSMRLAAAQTLGEIAQTATATVPPLSGISAFQVLGGPVSAATAKVLARATAAQTMGGISSQAAAVVLAVRLASASQTLDGIGQAATASLAARASAAQTMAGLLASAQLSSALALAGAQQLGGIQPAATATVADTVHRLQAAQILGAIQQFAHVRKEYVFDRNERTYSVVPQFRVVQVVAESRILTVAPQDRTIFIS